MAPGVCAFPSALDAAALCTVLVECRAVTVYPNGVRQLHGPVPAEPAGSGQRLADPLSLLRGAGTDGCSDKEVALLKRSSLTPSNEFTSPSVYTLEITERSALVSMRSSPCSLPLCGPTAVANSGRHT